VKLEIRLLEEADAALYQELRLRALKDHPDSFGSTYEKEETYSLETIKERIKSSENKFVIGAFDRNRNLYAIATFIRETNIKLSHKGHVFGMYVAPERRGNGEGKRLLTELVKVAKGFKGLEQIHLSVVSENQTAKKLYEALGFQTYGVEPNALKLNDQYYDEDLMLLRLTSLKTTSHKRV
jgi:ribosomal protein S18 acetylase RimI-like enzyme